MLDTGVAGHDVDAADCLHHLLHQVVGLGGIADVGAERGDLVTFVSQLGDEFVGRGLVGDVVDRDRPSPMPACPPVVLVLSSHSPGLVLVCVL